MPLSRLIDGAHPLMAPKAAGLARAAAAGLPVPDGVTFPLAELALHLGDPRLGRLLAAGPVIVRSALAFEDREGHSGAGLGISVGGVRDLDGVREAVAAIDLARREYVAPADAGVDDHVIVQHEVAAAARVVVACEPAPDELPARNDLPARDDLPQRDYLEEYDGSIDAFAGAQAPRYTGPAAAWASPAAEATAAVLARVRASFGMPAHGLDVELVVDHDGDVQLVQVRPLGAPLHPGWPAFVAAVRRHGDEIPTQGTLVLDVEHNPDPLSFAHAWLVRWLAVQRPQTGGLVPLGGWLYTRVLIRDLDLAPDPAPDPARDPARDPADTIAAGERDGPRAALHRLQRVELPAARRRLDAIAAASATADADGLTELFAHALAAFVAMIDVYVTVLIPAGRHHRALVPDTADPLCLRGRGDMLDVLPLAWDVAAPTLGERLPESGEGVVPDDDGAAATLLREWDDHLFALGLAPVRAVYNRAAVLSGLGDDVFHLAPDECVDAARGRIDIAAITSRIRERTAARTEAAELHPPGRIVDGEPAGVVRQWLRGLPIGPSMRGPIAQRTGLQHLRAEPPAPTDIVVLPALTAPAAVVLHQLGVRAICCEHGGAMSHAALIARELQLSALLGCRGCTTLADGTLVELDTHRGALRVMPTR